jgi:SAM-dependent methyltransferase
MLFRSNRRRATTATVLAVVIGVIVLTMPAALGAQTAQKSYEPVVGQGGKDAVWVPTGPAMVERMLDHAKVTPQDFVMDLGSGDGRTIIAAAKRGARALGVEFNADLVDYSRRQAAAAGVADKASFEQGDMYAADISKATVLALFLLPSNIEKLVPKFLELPPGTRIVANTFWVPDWTPDDTQTLAENCENWCTSRLFIIPAKVAGRWRVGDGVVELTQKFQMVEGTYTPATGAPALVKGRLLGSVITVSLGPNEYEGTVNGNTMEGAAKSGNRQKIVATRIQ